MPLKFFIGRRALLATATHKHIHFLRKICFGDPGGGNVTNSFKHIWRNSVEWKHGASITEQNTYRIGLVYNRLNNSFK